jgi:beta-lactamase regulating signal transducer with metallopeptidase domain
MQHFLQGTCSTVLWFHPALWTAAYRADLAREYMCDEAVIAKGGKLTHYLGTLIDIAEQCIADPAKNQPAGVLAFGNQKNALLRRCERLATIVREQAPVSRRRQYFAYAAMIFLTATASQIWLPTNALATSRSSWSPWPKWTASILHDFDIQVRDFETFDERTQIYELLFDD